MKKIKMIFCLIITLIMALSISGCSKEVEGNVKKESAPTVEINNSMGNLQNDGLLATDGKSIFYDNGNGLFSNAINGGKKRMISSDYAEMINVSGNYVYYYSTSPSGGGKGLWRVTKDGKDKTKIRNDSLYNLIVTQDSIYFSQKTEANSNAPQLMKMDINNLMDTPVEIYDGYTYSLNHENGWFYFYSDNEGGICKISTEGNNFSKILSLDTEAQNMIVENGLIYYYIEDKGIFSIKTDGKDKKQINNLNDVELYAQNFNFNVKNGFIYLPGDEDLYRINISNGNLFKISSKIISKKKSEYDNILVYDRLQVADDNLYFLQENDDFDVGLYKLNTDQNEFSLMN